MLRFNYLYPIFNNVTFIRKVNIAHKILAKYIKKHKIDAIAFSGMSGAAYAFVLSYKLKIPLICIRKIKDNSHCKLKYNGNLNIKKYIIVDDFIESGKTIKYIVETINSNYKKHIKKTTFPKLIGIYLFDSDGYSPFKLNKEEAIPIIK